MMNKDGLSWGLDIAISWKSLQIFDKNLFLLFKITGMSLTNFPKKLCNSIDNALKMQSKHKILTKDKPQDLVQQGSPKSIQTKTMSSNKRNKKILTGSRGFTSSLSNTIACLNNIKAFTKSCKKRWIKYNKNSINKVQ